VTGSLHIRNDLVIVSVWRLAIRSKTTHKGE
jgi:hypothetical protein